MDVYQKSLQLHREWRGKTEVASRVKVADREALSLAYTPGVAEPCRVIQKDINESFNLTRRWNTVAVITDGTAVLGLGDIGPEAGMPVMEGKCLLFKEFGGVDAVPLCIRSKNVDEIVDAVALFAGSFGGINLEDISAPRCFEIEKKLIERCDIPVFHDDQHGTAVCVLAGLTNAFKVVGKKLETAKVVISGAGSAGIAIGNLLLSAGLKDLIMTDKNGILTENGGNFAQNDIAARSNPRGVVGGLKEAMIGADAFIGVSAPNVVSLEMAKSMAKDAVTFAMANPVPEIMPEVAEAAGIRIIGTGRSDFPNQINNVLVFPHIFRGALDVRAKVINEEMKLAAAKALAEVIKDDELNEKYILPEAFDPRVAEAVSEAVKAAALKSGVARLAK